jgi:hypothetical protein
VCVFVGCVCVLGVLCVFSVWSVYVFVCVGCECVRWVFCVYSMCVCVGCVDSECVCVRVLCVSECVDSVRVLDVCDFLPF